MEIIVAMQLRKAIQKKNEFGGNFGFEHDDIKI